MREKCCTQQPPTSPTQPKSTREFRCQGCITAPSRQINVEGKAAGCVHFSNKCAISTFSLLTNSAAASPELCHFCFINFQVLHTRQCPASFKSQCGGKTKSSATTWSCHEICFGLLTNLTTPLIAVAVTLNKCHRFRQNKNATQGEKMFKKMLNNWALITA